MNRQSAPPSYEGRPLVRPYDEVVDQGLGFDVGTLMNRRRMLRTLGFGVATIGLAACGANAASTASSSSAATTATSAGGTTAASAAVTGAATTEIPDETAGPYPGDGSNGPDALEQSGIVRGDLRSSFGASSGTAEGVPINLELTITDIANGGIPFAGAAVYVWHCDREGRYSMYSDGVTDQNYLRGVQIADADGSVTFTSVYPACYAGRWPHIHYEVYPSESSITDAANKIATSQLALPDDANQAVYATSGYEGSPANYSRVSLDSDNVFSDGTTNEEATVTGDVTTGYTLTITSPVSAS